MRKIMLFLAGMFLTICLNVKADEGMWLLTLLGQLNMDQMHDMGLQLTADQIYSINHSSLKDAVGALDYGSCTSELVSAEGLVLTNHHCGYGEIQSHSSVEHDYLKNGFWAMTKEEELPNPGKTISYLVRMEDITNQVLPLLSDDLTGPGREQKVEMITDELVKKATEGTQYEARVKSFFNGTKYFLIVLETYRDVRLVGAPPESIGKFGYDTDNWMWPRHTGDFSIFRVYTAPDGSPADYSPDNVPLKSRYFLPVSLKGYKKGDFTMVMGYPGSTDRYMTSFEVKELQNIEHPNRIKIRGLKQQLMMEDMVASDAVRIMYASKYSRSSNYWKYSIGQSEGLQHLRVIERKQALEKAFTGWANSDSDLKARYGRALGNIEEGVTARKDLVFSQQYLFECMYQGMETVRFGLNFRKLFEELSKDNPDPSVVKNLSAELKSELDNFYRDYNLPTDKKITAAMLKLMLNDMPADDQPSVVRDISVKYKGNCEKYTDWYYKKSMLPYQDKVEAFLENPSLKVLKKDPAFLATMSFLSTYFEISGQETAFDAKVEEGRRLWMEGLRKMETGKTFYPDANSSLRLTYGTVGDYKSRDAVYYSHFTTLQGVMEKEDPSNPEFRVPDKLKTLYREKDYGPYAGDGTMHVCFTTNNDITGGNSGSPVMNAKGELIGIAFDGNWEAMSGDIIFEPELQKCICVDIRYVLFIIDKYAGDSRLIDEMKIDG